MFFNLRLHLCLQAHGRQSAFLGRAEMGMRSLSVCLCLLEGCSSDFSRDTGTARLRAVLLCMHHTQQEEPVQARCPHLWLYAEHHPVRAGARASVPKHAGRVFHPVSCSFYILPRVALPVGASMSPPVTVPPGREVSVRSIVELPEPDFDMAPSCPA